MNKRVLWTSLALGAIALPAVGFLTLSDGGNAYAGYGKKGDRYQHRMQGIVSMFDADQDGEVSREEFESALLERFDKVDQDGSGAVSIEELQDYRSAFRDEMRDWKRQMKQQRGSGYQDGDDNYRSGDSR